MSAFTLAVMAALAWGTASFFEKIGLRTPDPLMGVCARNFGVFIGTSVLFLSVPDVTTKMAAMGWRSFFLLAGGGCFASVLGQIFFYRALKSADIGPVTMVAGAWPMWAFVLSCLFLHEAITLKKVLGIAFVCTGVALLR